MGGVGGWVLWWWGEGWKGGGVCPPPPAEAWLSRPKPRPAGQVGSKKSIGRRVRSGQRTGDGSVGSDKFWLTWEKFNKRARPSQKYRQPGPWVAGRPSPSNFCLRAAQQQNRPGAEIKKKNPRVALPNTGPARIFCLDRCAEIAGWAVFSNVT